MLVFNMNKYDLLRHFTFILDIGQKVHYSFIWCFDWAIITNNNSILSHLNTQYKKIFIHCEFSVFYSWELYRNSAIRSLPSLICGQFGLEYYLLHIISEGASVVFLKSIYLSKIWQHAHSISNVGVHVPAVIENWGYISKSGGTHKLCF
jgi:hypothetical protein